MKISLFPQRIENIKLNIPKEILINEFIKEIDFDGSGIVFDTTKDKKLLAGFYEGDLFILRLKTSYVNSFKPFVTLNFYGHDGYSEIKLKYEIEFLAKIICWVFISFLGIMQILIIKHLGLSMTSYDVLDVFPSILLLVLFLFSRLGFYMSASQTAEVIKKSLLRIRNKFIREQRFS